MSKAHLSMPYKTSNKIIYDQKHIFQIKKKLIMFKAEFEVGLIFESNRDWKFKLNFTKTKKNLIKNSFV